MAAGGKFSANFGADNRLKLTGAIMIYSGGNNGGAFANYHGIYLDKQKQPALLEGSPLGQTMMAAMVRDFSKNAQVGSFLSGNVLSVGMDSLVWWIKPSKREIHFSCNKAKTGIGVETAIVPHPAMIFSVSEGEWRVFAIKGNTRPTEKTALFQVPHFNVWAGGRICTGNVTLPKDYSIESMAAWEKAYFGSNFTHPNVTQLVNYEGGAYAFWRSMLDGAFPKFPNEVLVPGNLTLGNHIRKINGGSR